MVYFSAKPCQFLFRNPFPYLFINTSNVNTQHFAIILNVQQQCSITITSICLINFPLHYFRFYTNHTENKYAPLFSAREKVNTNYSR